MIFTSYYGNRNIPENFIRVQISNIAPPGYKVDFIWDTVFPDFNSLVARFKKGIIGIDEYTKEYTSFLNSNKDQIISELEYLTTKGDVVLLCYEKSGNFCHRQLLSEFLEEQFNIVIVELT